MIMKHTLFGFGSWGAKALLYKKQIARHGHGQIPSHLWLLKSQGACFSGATSGAELFITKVRALEEQKRPQGLASSSHLLPPHNLVHTG